MEIGPTAGIVHTAGGIAYDHEDTFRGQGDSLHTADNPGDLRRTITSEEVEASAAVLRKINGLWRDPQSRLLFEAECGLEPIVSGNSLEVEAQHQSGRTEAYHQKFKEWAVRQP